MNGRCRDAGRTTLAVVAGLLAALSVPAARSGAEEETVESPSSWYAASIARSEGSFLLTHYWSKGTRLRAETVAGGRRLITIVDPTTYYVIDPTRAEAVAIERSPLAIRGDATRERPFADELNVLLRLGGEYVGEEDLAGQTADRYQLTNEAGRIQIWVRGALRLPVRIDRYVRASGSREQVDYINWLPGAEIADSFFEPPAGAEIERIGYQEYLKRARTERLGPAPPFYANLLHGEPDR